MAAVIVGAILSLTGGMGAAAAPLAQRLVHGEVLMISGLALGYIASRRLVPRVWFETRRLVAAILTTVIIGLPMTMLAALSAVWTNHAMLGVPLLADVLPTTLATTAGIVAIAFLMQSRTVSETHLAPKGAPPPRFLARVPAKLAGADLWAVESDDHYLRLHTSRGSDLILMRLADAVVELEGIEGARTHRSWWVARDAVTDVERADGRATLILPDGTRAPVSRAYLKALREGGWLD